MRSRLLSAVALVLVCALPALAQTSRGTVSGIVTDQNGSVIPAAEAELKNTQTNQIRTTTTNDSGLYRFDAVDLGVYNLTIKAKGFKAISNTGLKVQANRTSTIDANLEVGTTEIVVNVSSEAGELLQTSEPVRGGNFSAQQVTSLPISSGSAYDLGRLLPGVTTATGSGASFGNGNSQFSVNGQRPRGNNYLLDGVENNDISVGGPASEITNEDAVQEFSLQTGLFSAEFGRAGGGVFNVITKSGTNGFHGTVRWLILSERFNALTNNDRLSGLTKPAVFTENILSGSIGGPLPLPHFGEGGPSVVSGRNRTFFFFAPQWDRFRSTSNQGPFTVPSAAGFAQLQAQFPGNSRVATYLSAVGNLRGVTSLATIALGPDPVTGVDRGSIQVGQVGFATPTVANDRQMVLRVDHILTEKQTLSFRLVHNPSIFTPNLVNGPGFVSDFTGVNLNFLTTHNWTISSSLTNEFRFAFGRISFHFPLSAGNNELSKTLPQISIPSLSNIGVQTNIPQFRIANNYEFQDTVSKVWKTHTFRFGVEFLKQVAQQHPPFNERGSFGFTAGGGFTGLANFVDNFSGTAGSANINFGQPIYHPNLFRQSYFFQDTWKTTPNLTLTLGLRYENFGQPANSAFKFPAFAGFDPANFLVPNKVNPDKNNFGPIVGFAYSPNFKNGVMGWLFGERKSAIRGGYQVTYDTFFNNLLSNIAADSPNTLAVSFFGASTGRGTANFFPGSIPSTAPTPTALGASQASVFDPNIRNPYTQRYSLGIQREFSRINSVMDLSYVGSLGRKLFVTEDVNPRLPSGVRVFPLLGPRTIRGSGANSSYNSLQFRLDTRLAKQLQMTTSYTWSKYIDEVSEVFNTSSTASSLGSIPYTIAPGIKIDRGPSDYDRPQRLVISYVWSVPGPKSGFLRQVAGGWQIAGITSFQSGAPFNIVNGLDRNGDGRSTADRPDLGNPNAPHNTRAVLVTSSTDPCRAAISTGLKNPDTGQCVTRNDVYVVQAAANSGVGPATLGRNTERANPVRNFDMTISKNFQVTERFRFGYGLEAYNIFNHPQFTNIPGRNVTSTLRGQFGDFAFTNGGGRNMRMGLKILF